jgi:hypothetical protein
LHFAFLIGFAVLLTVTACIQCTNIGQRATKNVHLRKQILSSGRVSAKKFDLLIRSQTAWQCS